MTGKSGGSDVVSALHPALAGHFPGNPVVPGVVLLNRVCRALTREHGGTVTAMPVVKFHAPLRPAESFTIELMPTAADRYRFRVAREGTLIASGTLQAALP